VTTEVCSSAAWRRTATALTRRTGGGRAQRRRVAGHGGGGGTTASAQDSDAATVQDSDAGFGVQPSYPTFIYGSQLLNRLFKACLFESQLLAFSLKSWVLEAPQNMLLALSSFTQKLAFQLLKNMLLADWLSQLLTFTWQTLEV